MGVPIAARISHICVIGGMLAVALFFPFVWFGVTPFSSNEEFSDEEISKLLEGKPREDYYAAELPERTSEELAAQKEAFTWCRFCHTLEKSGHNRVGPNLYRIFGQPAAVVDHFPYSSAFEELRESGLIWTPENMAAFIADPHVMVPGNRMRYPPMMGYEMSAERDAMIIEYLLRETR